MRQKPSAPVLSRKWRAVVLWPSGRQRPEGPPQAVSIQQSHHTAVQYLEEEYIEEERKSQFNFLSICQSFVT